MQLAANGVVLVLAILKKAKKEEQKGRKRRFKRKRWRNSVKPERQILENGEQRKHKMQKI